MEVRGDIGWYNPGTDEYTIWMSSQTPHIQRLLLTAFVIGIPEHKVRCISPDVGGAFGTKIFCYADIALVLFASKAIGGRPVKWVESRRENYQSTIHGRDHITYLEIAGTRDGDVTGLRVKTLANLGGRLSTIGPGIPTTLYARVLSGCYKIPNVYGEVTGVYTNTTFVDAYRGAGRPEATYVVERAMDLFAAEIGMDRAELRRRNFIAPDKFPYENPSGLGTASGGAKIFIDSGNYEPALDKALAMAGYADMARPRRTLGRAASTSASACRPTSRSAASRRRKWIGAVGEGWGAAMWESANIKVHLTGKVVATVGTQPQGQGHETTYAQVVAHELGVPMEDVIVQHSDTRERRSATARTAAAPLGRDDRGGQGGRQGPREGPPVSRRTCSRRRRRHRGRRRELPGQGQRPTGSRRSRRSRSRSISGSIRPLGMEPYLDETAYYDTPNCTWPFGTHVAIVEMDEETGKTELVRYVAAARAVAAQPGARLAGLWTHLQATEDTERTRDQLTRFDAAADLVRAAGIPLPERHVAASGGLFTDVAALDGVRPGLAVYGVVPDELDATDIAPTDVAPFRPVMSLHARPVRVADLPAGHGISYGPTFTTARPSRIATLPLGYGDGFSRASRTGPRPSFAGCVSRWSAMWPWTRS